ncbi:radical SAM protein [Candidatus Bathyarchaeota archaeon]|nr:radical SAM protein [Candidatus Bathyarchaeota archaeon]
MKKRLGFYPYTILWDFTNKCNLRCVYCYNDDTSKQVLPLEEIEYGVTPPSQQPDLTVAQIRDRVIPQFEEMRVRTLCLSGGEPLVRWRDILEIAPDLCDIGLEEIMLATNGTLLTREKVREYKRAFKKVPMHFIALPLDSLDPGIVARLRPPMKDVLARTKKAIRLALEEGLIVTVETVVTQDNFDEIDDIISFSKEKNTACFAEIYPMFSEGRAKERNDLLLTDKQFREFDRVRLEKYGTCVTWDSMPFIPESEYWEKIKDKARLAEITEGCIAGREYLQLDHAGNVYPCSFLRIHCGNLLTQDLKDIWETNEMLLRFRNRDVGGKCGGCKHKETCGGCRARAYTETGDPFGGVESCEGGPEGHPMQGSFTETLKKTFKKQYRLARQLNILKKLHLLKFLRKIGVKGL